MYILYIHAGISGIYHVYRKYFYCCHNKWKFVSNPKIQHLYETVLLLFVFYCGSGGVVFFLNF